MASVLKVLHTEDSRQLSMQFIIGPTEVMCYVECNIHATLVIIFLVQ